MKHLAVLGLFTLVVCGCERNETITRLWTEQKLLKDSANNITKRIANCNYVPKGLYDSAAAQKKQLAAVHARLTYIQAAIDSRTKAE